MDLLLAEAWDSLLGVHGLSYLCCAMIFVPRPGIQSASAVLQGRFLTDHQGRPQTVFADSYSLQDPKAGLVSAAATNHSHPPLKALVLRAGGRGEIHPS